MSSEDDFKTVQDVFLKGFEKTQRTINDVVSKSNEMLYSQIESLIWLERRLSIKGQLPPLRGWATSPDVLLRLHTHIMQVKPDSIVEFGSGASTLVIADALRQNGKGKLYSIEHSNHYGLQTLRTLQVECLESWVDLRISDLELWGNTHLNTSGSEKPSKWYPVSLLKGIEKVDLIWVDGPPGATCLYSRYPALPALSEKLLAHTEIWMDDTNRQEEKDICEQWAKDYGFELEYFPLEKGLCRLTRPGVQNFIEPITKITTDINDAHPERAIGLDFSLPEKIIKP